MNYQNSSKSRALRCSDCEDKYYEVAGKCVHYDTSKVACPVTTTALAKYDGCSKCVTDATLTNGMVMVSIECKTGYGHDRK